MLQCADLMSVEMFVCSVSLSAHRNSTLRPVLNAACNYCSDSSNNNNNNNNNNNKAEAEKMLR